MFSENEDGGNSDAHETYSTESLPVALSSKMQVFLRIRPTSSHAENENHNDVYTIKNLSTLLVKNAGPNDSARRLKFIKPSDNPSSKKFTFSKIFNLEIGQTEFFNKAIKPTIIDFLNNQSSTIISYGTVNAGKTHTLFGSATEPGAIPRSIEFIYSSLNCTLTPWYKPKRFCSVVNLEECDRSLEIDVRDKLLSCRSIDKSTCEDAYRMLENSKLEKRQDILKDSMYSVWISFIEIYNDVIFDLLEVDEEGKNVQLKLAIDKHGCTYIQGMRSVCATTGLEAYEILNAGQTRLSTVSTSNYKSSRSHSIFTIKLLKYEKDCAPAQVKVSSLSFCDLAGTGRIQKTLSNSKELKESRSINTSLLALGRCIKAIAEGHTRQSIGPFRDSKLTRLFQRSLCGKENIILLINVNPILELFAETQSVLNFASTAMKTTSAFTKEDRKFVDYHMPISSPKVHESRLPIRIKGLRTLEIEDLSIKNKKLLAEINELKCAKLKREYEIRDELANVYANQLKDLEENWNNRMLAMEEEKENLLKFSVGRVECYYKGKLEENTNRKRKRIDSGDCEEHLDIQILETENSPFSSKILSLRKSLESMKNNNIQLSAQKNQQAYELSLLKKSLKKIAEFVTSADKKLESDVDYDSLNVEKYCKTSLDENITSYFSVIQEFIKSSFELKKCFEGTKKMKISMSKEVQCNLKYSIVAEFCREIEEILHAKRIELPKIDNSGDLSKELQDEVLIDCDLTTLLPRIKELITKNMSRLMKLEAENTEKSDQIKILNRKIKQQERDVLETKIQFQESECARLSLSKKLDDIHMKTKTKEFFKNLNLIMVDSENSLNNETQSQLIFTEQQSTPRHSLDNESYLSLFELDIDKIEISATRSSLGNSSKNDSGLASSVDCAIDKATDEKFCQTNILPEEHKQHSFQERLKQLKLDYKQMKVLHLQESLRVTELSQQLELIKQTMARLKENTAVKEQVIIEYEGKLDDNKIEIERLYRENRQLQLKYDELSKHLEESSKECEKKLNELQVKLRVHEEGENKAAKCLEGYWERKLNKLENELNVKRLNENELAEKVIEYEKDLAGLNKLSDKVHNFEYLMDTIKREKMDLHALINERLESQLKIKEQLQNLVRKIEKRDDEILSIKSELNVVIRTNLSNSRKAKELGREVTKLTEKTCTMKDDIIQSEEARKSLERISNKEIDNIRSRLSVFEENAELLNLICDTNESKQSEVDKLKSKLSEKEKELDFFKKNRNATIQRYECLVRQLQEALKINHHSNKLKKLFPKKQKYSFNDIKEICNVHSSEPQIRDWKSFNDDQAYSMTHSTSTQAITSSCESSESVDFNEEPCRLVTDVSEKSLEMRDKSYLKADSGSYKDLYSSNNFESSVGLNSFESDHFLVRTECQTKFHLHQKKSIK